MINKSDKQNYMDCCISYETNAQTKIALHNNITVQGVPKKSIDSCEVPNMDHSTATAGTEMVRSENEHTLKFRDHVMRDLITMYHQ